ncbi:hypothetical protein [Olivibacter sitiensis]|uniref:hypothetical protein n=1 Tax=Olivibacter sitiensis TaxID=376470 RepID=UPI000406BC8D|nr:hypothetical protein [Olivibacter sitiensis]
MTTVATRPITLDYAGFATSYYGGRNDMDRITEPVSVYPSAELFDRITGFLALGDNWDGYGAVPPSFSAVRNTMKLLALLPRDVFNLLDVDDIICTSYGTVVMDFQKENRLLSVEIGDKGLGYFMKQNDEITLVRENELFNGIAFSSDLNRAFAELI